MQHRWLVAAAVVFLPRTPGGARADGDGAPAGRAEYAPDRLLVRLATPLTQPSADGAYPLETGLADVTRTNEGQVTVFFGSTSGLPIEPDWFTASHQPEAELAYSVAGAGDVNGDGRDDLLVGTYLYDDGKANEGRATVFHGPLTEPPAGDCER